MKHSLRIPAPCCGDGATMHLRWGATVYPHRRDLAAKPIWVCEKCGGRVGCHPGSTRPLGTPATADLRSARNLAHAVFDRLWRSGRMKRGEAYNWLAQTLNLTPQQAHTGQMDLETCRRVINAVADLTANEGATP